MSLLASVSGYRCTNEIGVPAYIIRVCQFMLRGRMQCSSRGGHSLFHSPRAWTDMETLVSPSSRAEKPRGKIDVVPPVYSVGMGGDLKATRLASHYSDTTINIEPRNMDGRSQQLISIRERMILL